MRASSPFTQHLIIVLVLLFLLLASSLLSVRAERLPLKAYTTADGLAHNEINNIIRDSRGFLWFCTAEGLSRFDGYAFTNYGTDQGLPSGAVNDFLETRSGEIWLATSGGLVRFNPKGAPTARVVYAHEANTSLPPMFTVVVPENADRYSKVVNVLLEARDGALWCGTNNGLYRLERTGGHLALYPVEIGMPKASSVDRRFVNDVIEDHRGSLWVAALGGLYRRGPDGSTRKYTTRDGLPDDNIHDLLEDHRGQLWAATRYGGFFRFTANETPGTSFVAEGYRRRDGLQTDWIFQLFETADQRFWVGTNWGLVEFFPNGDSGGRRFHAYTPRNGLSYHEITALGEDTGGNLWLGTNTAGAMKLARGGFVTYDEQDGVLGVSAIFEDTAGRVYFKGNVIGDKGTFEGPKPDQFRSRAETYYVGFGSVDDGRFNWFRPAAPLNFGWVMESAPVQTRDGEWWVGSGEGLYRFPASDSFSQIKTARPLAVYLKKGLVSSQVWRLFADSAGGLWASLISAPNGLVRWDREKQSFRDLANSPGLPSLKDELPRSFGEDVAGNVWVGLNTGVARHRDGQFHFFSTRDGLPPGAIMNIHSDRAGRLWLASSRGGLVRVDDPAAEHPSFSSYTTAEGLSSNSTEAMAEDLEGNIYVGTGRGLDQLDPETGRIKHFTTADGLAVSRVVAAFCDRNGVLWFGAVSGGFLRFMPSSTEAASPPPILLTGLRVAGEAQIVSAVGDREIVLADLDPDRNQLQIDFVALGFAPGDRLRYQYRLEGSGADWSAPTELRTVNLSSLASGSYRFEVRAVNSDGVFSLRPATITFTVLRPFWLRWWFMLSMALVLTALIYAAYRFRLARLLEVADMRTRIATDLHDDIGTNLTKIAILSEVARRQFGNGGGGDGLLSSIAGAARESVASMGDIVWAINPQRDSLLDLVRRMRRHAQDLFASGDISLDFDAPGVGEQLKLSAEVRRDVFLIFKEATGNAVRHSRCSEVSISLRPDGSWLVLEIVDNGIGFDPTVASEGQGLMSMRRRANGLDGTFEIESGASRGTTLRVRVRCVRQRSAPLPPT